jgi:dipeptidase D
VLILANLFPPSISQKNTLLCQLEPKALWQVFDLFTQCPRPSRHEECVLKAIESLCEHHQLTHFRDAIGNLIISKPATAGMEHKKGVVMQGHIDMVPQKNEDSAHNFITDPITTLIEGDWVTADGTTLGADNGIGVAAALAVFISNDIQHGPLELLITIDEESGMAGAYGLQSDSLSGDILLNLDTEDEGEIYVGCAGGVDVSAQLTMEWQALNTLDHEQNNQQAYQISIKGLRGGHSGLDIDQGRANANKLINQFLLQYQSLLNLQVFSFNGGTLRNAIARESFTNIVINANKENELHAAIEKFTAEIALEYGAVDTNFNIQLNTLPCPDQVYTQDSLEKLLNSVSTCVHGVTKMSDEFQGVVDTSNNLAIVKSDGNTVNILTLVRSLNDNSRDELANTIKINFEDVNASVNISGEYPGWKPDPASNILQTLLTVYQTEFSKPAKIKVIHAGLECGLFNKPYPHWDMISIGPTIRNAHSPDEKVHIESVKQFWDFLLAALKAIPEDNT